MKTSFTQLGALAGVMEGTQQHVYEKYLTRSRLGGQGSSCRIGGKDSTGIPLRNGRICALQGLSVLGDLHWQGSILIEGKLECDS